MRVREESKKAGVPDYFRGKSMQLEARNEEALAREDMDRALRGQSPKDIAKTSAFLKEEQQYIVDADAYSERVRDSAARGDTAGIPGARTPDPYSSESAARKARGGGGSPMPKIKPGNPAEMVGGLATLAATAIPTIGVMGYRQSQDAYERLRFIALKGPRKGPLERSDLNSTTLGMLLQDPQMADQLYREGLLSQPLQDLLLRKRQQHGY